MIPLKQAIGACILACVLLAIPAHTATYYVATTGSNSNPGTEKKPWQTVAYAVNTMVAGDTTYVRGGLYNEGTIRFKRSGTQSAQIKLVNYPGEAPIIHCIDPKRADRILLENSGGINKPMGWITIEGFEIRNCYDGLKFHNAHDLTVRRNWIHNNSPGQGILGNGTRILIDGNTINHNGGFAVCSITPSECTKDHGIYTSGTAFTITNNLIYDNLSYGIQVAGAYEYNPAQHAGPEYAHSKNWIIANNTIAYQNHRGAIVLWGFSVNDTRIENNIFYENGVNLTAGAVNGIDFVSMTGTGITIRHNMSYASGSGAMAFHSPRAIEGVHYTQSGNLVNEVNPRFVNAPAALPDFPNFALTDRSPAIDAGLPLVEIRSAFDGSTRPQGRAYDIGAYEYSADSDIRPPKAPMALQIH